MVMLPNCVLLFIKLYPFSRAEVIVSGEKSSLPPPKIISSPFVI